MTGDFSQAEQAMFVLMVVRRCDCCCIVGVATTNKLFNKQSRSRDSRRLNTHVMSL